MKDIIIAYPNRDVALQLRSLLDREGYHVSYICATGSSVLGIAQDVKEGVVIAASILRDMPIGVLSENLPAGFDIIALSKNGREEYFGNLINLPLPLHKDEFLETVSVLVSTRSSFSRRDKDDSELISKAKLVIMKMNSVGEIEAHKYLQQESMRKGKKLTDLAKEIINDFTE